LNKYLQDLITLSKYDTSISQFDPQIENQKSKLAVFIETIEALKSSINSVYLEIDELKSKITKHNIHLADLQTKLNSIANKNKNVTNERELKALQLEEDIAKEQIAFANEEIERLDKLSVAKTQTLNELKEKLKVEEEDIKEIKEAVDKEIEAIDEKRSVIYVQRNELLGQFDKKILTFYEKIRRWAKNTAVAPVKKQACYGCFMKINDKTYAEVIKGEEIVNCLHCGRILYKGEEEIVAKEA